MLCRLRFINSFQSDNHVHCELNNKDFILFIEIVFKLCRLCWSLPYDYFMMLCVELIIELDKTDKCKPILIVKDIIEQAKTVLYAYKFAF